ncbi:MAG: 2-amino-3,7-dideoxy-D-threo-hept-6-ulosonate synthase [Candidatus Korarchaeota archaeon]|nr:2-amino-3,7-dideoxy-D-threo-hept-6-ulosonate synthase [Candidatus Korarchaeota archaeon]
MNIGKIIRLERIFNREKKKTIIIPLDHGVSVGPIYGLTDLKSTINQVAEGGANAVVLHKGLVVWGHRGRGKDIGLIVHLSASTSLASDPNKKVLVGDVKDAIKLGADGVSIHINLGDEAEDKMLMDFGKITSEAEQWGVPVLAMVYARGPNVKNSYDPGVVAHCARVAQEMGADVVKVNYTGDRKSFEKVVNSCSIPVVIAGGPKMGNKMEFLTMVYDSIKAGGAGLSVGRNVFQDENPTLLVKILTRIVHEGMTPHEAVKDLG